MCEATACGDRATPPATGSRGRYRNIRAGGEDGELRGSGGVTGGLPADCEAAGFRCFQLVLRIRLLWLFTRMIWGLSPAL